ncbi:hypothetical protein [Enterobacter hormaechei]|uniref:hypothetical protein n=1 Tax=Enterobacter hormaechei TaxID=158836 RepID=UPI00079ADC83|nr:hypothetical protein [Enterobacter hormaechei]QLT99097.1 hypothetical protein HV163_08840 [Enterobacter hormaechei]SAB96919.1 Uncharacterised protein [Enterobacter hormaechei]SAF38371.1 Uncharacterised protein [Enterobacter hormaechei]VAK54136.1 Uncharacterised protein [Enterobacter hormaechei]VAK92189.1 Uncharacterised protein [Enterobacter hormaechei]
MGNKNGFDPGIRKGVQVYCEHGERIVVVHPGGYLDSVGNGQCVLFETKPKVDGTRMYWFGIVSSTAYYFVLEEAKPVNIFAIGSWFNARQNMLDAHNGNLDEFSDMQGELPF